MESVKFTITSGQFNLAPSIGIITDVSKIIPWDNNRTYYPREITIINSTSTTVGVLYLNGEERANRLNAYPTFYSHAQILTNSTIELPIYTKYIIFKLLSGSASGDLDFYCTSYSSF